MLIKINMLDLNSILVFSENPEKLVEFYTKVFQKAPEWKGGEFSGWKVKSCFFTVGPHNKVKGKSKNPERIMYNFETQDVEKEFERIKELGAKVITDPYNPGEAEEMKIATFADPDGNYFQLVSPMK